MKKSNKIILFLLVLYNNIYSNDSTTKKLSLISKIGILASSTILAKILHNKYIFYKTKKAQNSYVQNEINITPQTIFVFDINDVIIKPDFKAIFWDIIVKRIFKSHKLELGSALLKFNIYKIIIKCAARGCGPEEYLEEIQKKYPEFKDLCKIGLEIANTQKEVSGMFKLIESLHNKGHKLLFLSNVGKDKIFADSESSIEMLVKQFPILKYFDLDASFLTTKENKTQDNKSYLKKPNPDSYKLFLEKFKQKYGQDRIKDIVFIEDRIKNVLPAIKEGIYTIWFTSAQDLEQKISEQTGPDKDQDNS